MAVDTNVTKQNGSDAITTISMAVAAAATGLAAAQAVAAPATLVLNGTLIVGGVYTGTGARRMVAVSTSAGDTTQTVTFVGTDRYGNALTESVLLNGNVAVTTVNDFLTVTKVTVNAAAVGNISAGTSAKASGAWISIDRVSNNPVSIALLCTLVSGAANFTVEETFDDPNGNQPGTLFPIDVNPSSGSGLSVGTNYPPVAQADATIAAKAATIQGSIALPFWAYRLTLNSGVGVVQMQGLAAMKPWHH